MFSILDSASLEPLPEISFKIYEYILVKLILLITNQIYLIIINIKKIVYSNVQHLHQFLTYY